MCPRSTFCLEVEVNLVKAGNYRSGCTVRICGCAVDCCVLVTLSPDLGRGVQLNLSHRLERVGPPTDLGFNLGRNKQKEQLSQGELLFSMAVTVKLN